MNESGQRGAQFRLLETCLSHAGIEDANLAMLKCLWRVSRRNRMRREISRAIQRTLNSSRGHEYLRVVTERRLRPSVPGEHALRNAIESWLLCDFIGKRTELWQINAYQCVGAASAVRAERTLGRGSLGLFREAHVGRDEGDGSSERQRRAWSLFYSDSGFRTHSDEDLEMLVQLICRITRR